MKAALSPMHTTDELCVLGHGRPGERHRRTRQGIRIDSDEDDQPTLTADPLGHETAIDYQAGAAVPVTDALGNVSRAFADAADGPSRAQAPRR
jgi:hypothetical protein